MALMFRNISVAVFGRSRRFSHSTSDEKHHLLVLGPSADRLVDKRVRDVTCRKDVENWNAFLSLGAEHRVVSQRQKRTGRNLRNEPLGGVTLTCVAGYYSQAELTEMPLLTQ